jgi:hypothetical protein
MSGEATFEKFIEDLCSDAPLPSKKVVPGLSPRTRRDQEVNSENFSEVMFKIKAYSWRMAEDL